MPSSKPHWSPEADFSSCPFFIRRMDTVGYSKPAEAPVAHLPLISFIYVTSGEVLVDVDGTPFLCQTGHILLIPQQQPFAIRYYRSAIGYTGGFAPSFLPDAKPLRYLSAPLHQGFWFDEGAFVAELFNMLATSFEKGDRLFVEKGLDLLLSRIKPDHPAAIPAAVSAFLESVFDPNRLPGTIASCKAVHGPQCGGLDRHRPYPASQAPAFVHEPLHHRHSHFRRRGRSVLFFALIQEGNGRNAI